MMIVFNLVSACLVTLASATTTTVIRMDRTYYYSFPIEYIPEEVNARIPGRALLNTFDNFAPLLRSWYGTGRESCLGMLVGDNRVRIDFETPMRITESCDVFLGIGFGSGFAGRFPNHLLTPVSQSEALLVLNPTNPAEYADGGRILYTPLDLSLVDTRQYPIRGALRLSEEPGRTETTVQPLTDSDFFPLGIQMSAIKHTIPRRLLNQLIARIEALGIETFEEGRYMCLNNVTPEQFRALPSFDIIVQSEDGSRQYQIGQLEPDDYLFYTECTNVYEFDLTGGNEFVMNGNLTQKLLIHFDYEHNRIGFADPLVEL